MPISNIFLDTNIILDYIVPSRRQKYACSYELIEKVRNGSFKAWTVNYALSETLGRLKEKREERIGVKNLSRQTLSAYEISQIVQIIEQFRKTPNFEVFVPEPISQKDIFDKVQNICVQATDALVILSVLNLKEKLGNVTLVTRDRKLLIRSKRLIQTAHPIELIGSCPANCQSKFTCSYHR